MDEKINKYASVKALVIASTFIILLFSWQGNKGFSLWDEGYLWYGVQRVLQGEVPMLDFMAYDPGRYYWSAAWLKIFDSNGIMSLRAAIAIFQVIGLFLGVFLIEKSKREDRENNNLFLITAAAILVIWMHPRHKIFDATLSLTLVYTLASLAENPTFKRYFISGVVVGFVAFFGKNHGVYGAVGSLGIIAWLEINNHRNSFFLKKFGLWGAGVAIGFSPAILMALTIPGFVEVFWENIRFIVEQGATGLSLPVPWPWTVGFSFESPADTLRGLIIGLFFIGTLTFGVIGIMWVVYQRTKGKPASPGMVASAFLALPYAHYAFSRADVGHLALGVFPFLVGSLVFLANSRAGIKWPFTAIFFASSLLIMHAVHPGGQCLVSKQCISVEISGSELEVDPATSSEITLLRDLDEKFSPNKENFVATPFWPGAYALLERKSPMWEIYALFPRSKEFEEKEIERIKKSAISFALITDFALDGRDELRFKNTHPLIYKYIIENFDLMPGQVESSHKIYKSRRSRE